MSSVINNQITNKMDERFKSIDSLKDYKVVEVEDGRNVANYILKYQIKLTVLMSEAKNNKEWDELNDKHYNLRQIRRRILNDVGKLVMSKKREKNEIR